jgi:hypothetical protein
VAPSGGGGRGGKAPRCPGALTAEAGITPLPPSHSESRSFSFAADPLQRACSDLPSPQRGSNSLGRKVSLLKARQEFN